MVVDSLVYHPSFRRAVAFLDKLACREKVLRLVQYFLRFLAFYLARKGFLAETTALVKLLQKNMQFLRKAFRALKPLSHLEEAAKAFDNKLVDPVLRYLTVVRNLAYFFYLGLDQVTWLKLLGLVSTKTLPTVPRWCNRFWAIALVLAFVNEGRKIQINLGKKKALLGEEKVETAEVAKVNKALYDLKRKVVLTAFDSFIVLNSLEYLSFDEGAIGLAGTVTSLAGLRDLWTGVKV